MTQPTSRGSDLGVRAMVGVVLIAVAVGALYLGGFGFGVLVTLGVLLMFTEWAQMFDLPRGWRLAGMTVLALTLALAEIDQALIAVTAIATGAGVLMLGARPHIGKRASWISIGLLYCGLPGIALIWMRSLNDGFALALLTLAAVWATDIAAYFAGRSIGGPKLAPAISPNKTWSGLAGGMVGAALAVALIVHFTALPGWLVWTGAALAVVAQLGDLYESGLKRRLGVKDSGSILPGHGGILDRVDGLVPVAVLMALVVALMQARGGMA